MCLIFIFCYKVFQTVLYIMLLYHHVVTIVFTCVDGVIIVGQLSQIFNKFIPPWCSDEI